MSEEQDSAHRTEKAVTAPSVPNPSAWFPRIRVHPAKDSGWEVDVPGRRNPISQPDFPAAQAAASVIASRWRSHFASWGW